MSVVTLVTEEDWEEHRKVGRPHPFQPLFLSARRSDKQCVAARTGRSPRKPSRLGYVSPHFYTLALCKLTSTVTRSAGRVYHIPPELAAEIWAYLDHREKDGYTLRTVDVFGVDPATGEEVIVQRGVGSCLLTGLGDSAKSAEC